MSSTSNTDQGGLGLALLESKLSNDKLSFNILTDSVDVTEIVQSAAALATFIARRAAIGMLSIDSGEQVSDDADEGLWRVLAINSVLEPSTPDDPIIGANSNVYRARDCFLTSLRDSVASGARDAHGDILVGVELWAGWNQGDKTYEVVIGVGMALERLFLCDLLSEETDTDGTLKIATRGVLSEYARFVAGGLLRD
jgi:hypothetical protein